VERKDISYWRWLFRGTPRAGCKRLVNWWLPGHVVIGVALAAGVLSDIAASANTVLLPLVGILIGLTFAWAGNAQALLQSEEMQRLSDNREGGYREYVFAYQTAILVILITLVLWAIAGLRLFDTSWPTRHRAPEYFAVKSLLFTLSSLTLRECWQTVMGAQWMLLAQKTIRDIDRR